MYHFKILALRISEGGNLVLISGVKALAFRFSGGGDLALMSHVKTQVLKVSGGGYMALRGEGERGGNEKEEGRRGRR